MALNPIERYPAQIDTDVAYPFGKARNAGSYQDGTGTPFEKDLVNDIFGFQQALLVAAAMTPSGDPDTATVSEYLAALRAITALKLAVYSVSGTAVAYDAKFALSETFQRGGFGLASNVITMPAPGRYLALLLGAFTSPSTDNPKNLRVGFASSGGAGAFSHEVTATRRSAVAADKLALSLMRLGNVIADDEEEDPSVKNLQVVSGTEGGLTGDATLLVLGLGT